jgi:hypothetical protein
VTYRLLVLAVLLAQSLAAPLSARAQETASATITIRDHRFEPAELRLPANARIQLKVINDDPPRKSSTHAR